MAIGVYRDTKTSRAVHLYFGGADFDADGHFVGFNDAESHGDNSDKRHSLVKVIARSRGIIP